MTFLMILFGGMLLIAGVTTCSTGFRAVVSSAVTSKSDPR